MSDTAKLTPAAPGSCLIVEDSRFDQKLIKRVLDRTNQNYRTRIVSTLTDARDVLTREPISLILLDNNLPDGKGADFAMELATMEELAGIPVIIVSDWPSPFMWQKAKIAGVACVVNKSDFTPEVVIQALPTSDAVH
ncbi:MAG: response regulator [Pseudomonadota bacterium]|nr:response regulator [Pseudomonadota bacterium]